MTVFDASKMTREEIARFLQTIKQSQPEMLEEAGLREKGTGAGRQPSEASRTAKEFTQKIEALKSEYWALCEERGWTGKKSLKPSDVKKDERAERDQKIDPEEIAEVEGQLLLAAEKGEGPLDAKQLGDRCEMTAARANKIAGMVRAVKISKKPGAVGFMANLYSVEAPAKKATKPIRRR